jgi:hypothetical protein
MSGFTIPVAILTVPTDQINFSNGIQPVNISNLDSDTNAVIYTDNTGNLKGDSTVLKFDEALKKLTVYDSLGFISAYPIGLEAGFDDVNFCTGVMSQNKNSADGASTHILISNDLGTDFSNYGGLDMASSNSTIQSNQFATMPNALGLSSQTSSIVLTANAGGQAPVDQNENIMFCYANGTKANLFNQYGQLVVGASNPDYSGSTYGGDAGGSNKSLTSDGTNGLKWVTPHTNVVKFLKHDHGALTAQSALTVDVVPVFTRVTTANDCLFQFYAELYCTISGYQTYALLVDGISVETFQSGMTLPNILTNITYTFKSTLTAGSHTFKVTATATSGTLETNANSCYQYTLSQIV